MAPSARPIVERWLILGVLSLSTFGCAPRLPPAYVAHQRAAERAYEQGDYTKAAHAWRAAAEAAPSGKRRDEAVYRSGTSFARAGQAEQARAAWGELTRSPGGARRARAHFDIAHSSIDEGDTERGFALLKAALLEFPDSGMSLRAARRLLAHAGDSGSAAELALLEELEAKTRGHEISEYLLRRKALWFDRASRPDAALAAYRRLIAEYPYPRGRYWDESVLRVAELDAALGRPEAAVSLLRWMLDHRERSNLVGSYERRYSEAHFLLASLLNDALNDALGAREEFRAIVQRYPTSRRRDDALWQAGLCSLRLEQPAEACSDAAKLRSQFPDSRYTPCTRHLCPELPATERRCHDYLVDPD